MKTTLRLEGLGLFLFALAAYDLLDYSWTTFAILFLTPDLGFLGYLVSKKVGAVTYNLLHHQGFIGLFLALGILLENDQIMMVSLIYFAHSNIDRVFGYGLRSMSDMHMSHMGKVGKAKHQQAE